MSIQLADIVQRDGDAYVVDVKGGPYKVCKNGAYGWTIYGRRGEIVALAPGEYATGLPSALAAIRVLLRWVATK